MQLERRHFSQRERSAGACPVDVARRAADVADGAPEEFLLFEMLQSPHQGVLASGNDTASLMGDQSAEGTAAGTSPHGGKGVADRQPRGDRLFIYRMRAQCIRELADPVEFRGGERLRRGFDQNIASVGLLKEFPSAPRVHFRLHGNRLTHDGVRIALHFGEGGQHGI